MKCGKADEMTTLNVVMACLLFLMKGRPTFQQVLIFLAAILEAPRSFASGGATDYHLPGRAVGTLELAGLVIWAGGVFWATMRQADGFLRERCRAAAHGAIRSNDAVRDRSGPTAGQSSPDAELRSSSASSCRVVFASAPL